MQQTVGDRVVYYGTESDRTGRFYKAVAKVVRIRPDDCKPDHVYADMEEHLNFNSSVDYLVNGGFEVKLVMPNGKINGGTAQSAVRLITPGEYSRIIEAGFHENIEWPERNEISNTQINDPLLPPGMAEEGPMFINRPIVTFLADRKFRDRKFRQQVLNAYDRRCAFTGLRLINGGGRPEVEAAHIIPVDENGSDSVRNGIALSGTVHWMFDRGLLSLADDFKILKSRQLNYNVDHLLNKDGKAILPENPAFRPQFFNIRWHRTNRLKR